MSIELEPPPREQTSQVMVQQWTEKLWRKVQELDASITALLAADTAISTRLTAWSTFTPVITNAGTVTSASGLKRRVGDSLECIGVAAGGTVTANPLLMTLPDSLAHSYSVNCLETGSLVTEYIGGVQGGIFPLINTGRPNQVSWTHNNSRNGLAELNANSIMNNTQAFWWSFRVKISGWT
jgi:hypothetical protein